MPPGPNPVQPIVREILTSLKDLDGSVILSVGLHEATIKYPDGRLEIRKIHDCIRTVDGSMWSPLEMAKPGGAVGICFWHRHPARGLFGRPRASHGIVRLSRAKTCPCGRLVCVAHQKQCSDGVIRCLPCARRWRWGQWLLSVFFRRE